MRQASHPHGDPLGGGDGYGRRGHAHRTPRARDTLQRKYLGGAELLHNRFRRPTSPALCVTRPAKRGASTSTRQECSCSGHQTGVCGGGGRPGRHLCPASFPDDHFMKTAGGFELPAGLHRQPERTIRDLGRPTERPSAPWYTRVSRPCVCLRWTFTEECLVGGTPRTHHPGGRSGQSFGNPSPRTSVNLSLTLAD